MLLFVVVVVALGKTGRVHNMLVLSLLVLLQGINVVVVVVRWYRLHCCSPAIQGESIEVLCCSLAVL